MPDREKVIEEFKERISSCSMIGDGFDVTINWKLADDILALLKEQEAVEPIPYHRSDGTIFKYECRQCRTKIFKMDLFCRHCGQAVKWDELLL